MNQCNRCGISLSQHHFKNNGLCLACSSIKHHEEELELLIKQGASQFDINSLKEFIEEEKRRWDSTLKKQEETQNHE